MFDRSRASAKRIRRIGEELRDLDDRVGPKGHTYEHHGKSDVLDPMRHVIDRLDGQAELERERAQCMLDTNAAQVLIWGMAQADDGISAMGDGEYVMTEYYVYGKELAEIAAGAGTSASMCSALIRECVRYCDEVGIAKLKGRMRYE